MPARSRGRRHKPATHKGDIATVRGQGVPPPPAGAVDLICTDITWTVGGVAKATPEVGDHVVFSAVVKNIGTATMPAGLIVNNQQLDCAVRVDTTLTLWADQYEGTLAAGASVTLTMNSGETGVNYWVATLGSGSHNVQALVNSAGVPRKAESDMSNNNTFQKTFPVTGGTPPPPPGGVQPVFGWVSPNDVVRLGGGADGNGVTSGGIVFNTLASNGVTGLLVTVGVLPDPPYPPWFAGFIGAQKAYGQLYVGGHVVEPFPTSPAMWDTLYSRWQALANNANEANADGLFMDLEPYNASDHSWDGSDHSFVYQQGLRLAPICNSVGPLIIYPSSNASFPGSYNDLIQTQAGGSNTYANSRFPDLLQGLIDGGCDITLLDASFHFGVQYQPDGGDWGVGAAHTVALTNAVYPTIRVSVMLWPDNDERNGGIAAIPAGFFDGAGELQNMITDALPEVTGPIVLFQKHMATGDYVSQWLTWFAEINAAT